MPPQHEWREKSHTRTIPALFSEKQVPQKLLPSATAHSQCREHMPARAAATSKHDALRMLQEADSHPDSAMTSTPMVASGSYRRTDPPSISQVRNWCIFRLWSIFCLIYCWYIFQITTSSISQFWAILENIYPHYLISRNVFNIFGTWWAIYFWLFYI